MAVAAPAVPSRAALYVRATRPLYLPTSLVPALAGGLVAIGDPAARWWILPVALVALLLLHAGTDIVNDVEDYARGIDGPEKLDNSRVFTSGALGVAEGRAVGLAAFAAAAAIGVAIAVVQGGPALVWYGIAGSLGAYLYSAGPRPYKHMGLGDTMIVPLMGPLLTQGAYTAVTGDPFHAPAFWLGLVPGLLITATVQGNNASDILTDAAAGVRTLAVRVGFRWARRLYLASLAAGYAAVVVLWATGLFGPAILAALLTLPLAAGRAAQARSAERSGDPRLLSLAPRTAQLHLLTSVLLVVGVALDRAL